MPEQKNEFFDKMKLKYENVFNSPDGKIVFDDILRSCFIYKTTFDKDASVMANNEGKRELALHIQYMATPQPDLKEGATEVKT